MEKSAEVRKENPILAVLDSNGTTSQYTSLGMVAPVVTALVLLINTLWGGGGELILQGDLDKALAAGDAAVNAVTIFIGLATNAYARYRAKRNIRTGEPLSQA